MVGLERALFEGELEQRATGFHQRVGEGRVVDGGVELVLSSSA